MSTGGMSYFKKPDKFRAYIVLFTIAVIVAFAAILLIPYFYDQINLSQFQHASEKNQLLIAELPAELQLSSFNSSTENGSKISLESKPNVKNKSYQQNLLDGGYKIISLDYEMFLNGVGPR